MPANSRWDFIRRLRVKWRFGLRQGRAVKWLEWRYWRYATCCSRCLLAATNEYGVLCSQSGEKRLLLDRTLTLVLLVGRVCYSSPTPETIAAPSNALRCSAVSVIVCCLQAVSSSTAPTQVGSFLFCRGPGSGTTVACASLLHVLKRVWLG